jgi:Tfp pilus assembly protein PilV
MRNAESRPLRHRRCPRRGLTLAELLIAGTVLVMIGGSAATLAFAVYSSYEVCREQSTAAQHARVALNRIEQAVVQATASESFPACHIVNFSADGYTFPDTLAVWRPSGTAANPTGIPLVKELIVFSCDRSLPSRLLEMTWPTNTNAVPATTDSLGWGLLLDLFHSDSGVIKNQLTDRLHKGTVDTTLLVDGLTSTERGAVRFQRLMTPSASHWSEYRGGQRTWHNLNWPLDLYGTQTGTRTVTLLVEVQIRGGTEADPQPLPFLGSASMNYALRK